MNVKSTPIYNICCIREYTVVETLVQLYDFRRTSKMKHEVRLPGSFLAFSEQNIAYFAGKTVSHHFQVYNWRAKGDVRNFEKNLKHLI
jgi:hypothetical protein